MNNSSTTRSAHTLAANVDEFLEAFVNDLSYAERRYPSYIPPLARFGIFASLARPREVDLDFKPKPSVQSDAEVRGHELAHYQALAREVWVAITRRERTYWSHQLRAKLYEAIGQQQRAKIPKTLRRVAKGKWERVTFFDPTFSEIAHDLPETAFERALDRLGELVGKTKRCGNPDCVTPLFIAARKCQRYCSEPCARVFQQEAKRNWWQKNGKLWREERCEQKEK